MQALIGDMKFMGPDEPGCRQPDFAKPQRGDGIMGLDPRLVHAGNYGRKDIVHFQFCLPDSSEEVELEKKQKTQKKKTMKNLMILNPFEPARCFNI
eukprot:g77568.t1